MATGSDSDGCVITTLCFTTSLDEGREVLLDVWWYPDEDLLESVEILGEGPAARGEVVPFSVLDALVDRSELLDLLHSRFLDDGDIGE